jgi:hypothetical protein
MAVLRSLLRIIVFTALTAAALFGGATMLMRQPTFGGP